MTIKNSGISLRKTIGFGKNKEILIENNNTIEFSEIYVLKLCTKVDLLIFIFSPGLLYLKVIVTEQNLIAKNSAI